MFLLSILKFFLLFPFNHPFLFLFHLLFNFIFAYYVYSKLKPFYFGDIHNKYPEFKRKDTIKFHRLYLGLVFLFWPRFFSVLFFMSFLAVFLLIKHKDDSLRPFKDPIYKFGIQMVLYSLGCILPTVIRKDKECEEVYKKYLGNDYKISYDKKFATAIGNHCSFIDAFYYTSLYCSSFIAKKTAAKVPLVSTIAIYNRTLYLDRSSEEDRHKMIGDIEKRQREVMDGKINNPLTMFPEGTVSMGNYIIKFKRGAFMSLLPVKPRIEMIDHNEEFELATGALPMHLHMVYACCFLYLPVTFIDMPVIEPTEYMYEKYKEFGNEKWMVYMEVTRRIMSEVSGLKLSNVSFPEKLEYISAITGKKVKNT